MDEVSKAELESQIMNVRDLRKAYDDLKAETTALEAGLNEQYKDLYASRNAALSKVAEEEDFLRELTLAAYVVDGNKKPAPGVGIRIVKRCEYDIEKAFQYAKLHGVCLKLDGKAFEALAMKSKDTDIPVTMWDEAQATIAKELA
jgi:ribosomal protein S5